jgi:hypothetical protein
MSENGPQTQVAAAGVGANEVAGLLAHSLGMEKAVELVSSTVVRLGLPSSGSLSREQTLEVLTEIAKEPGLVGISATFAKSRLHLMLKS